MTNPNPSTPDPLAEIVNKAIQTLPPTEIALRTGLCAMAKLAETESWTDEAGKTRKLAPQNILCLAANCMGELLAHLTHPLIRKDPRFVTEFISALIQGPSEVWKDEVSFQITIQNVHPVTTPDNTPG